MRCLTPARSAATLTLAGLALAAVAAAQAPRWSESAHIDRLYNVNDQVWVLQGKYLAAPRFKSEKGAPALVVECQPGVHKTIIGWHTAAYTLGHFVAAYIDTGAMIETGLIAGTDVSGATLDYRLDDGKLRSTTTGYSKDFTSLYLSVQDFATLLFGSGGYWQRREDTLHPVHLVTAGVGEYVAGEIEMQWQMPDPAGVANACGIIAHKGKSPATASPQASSGRPGH